MFTENCGEDRGKTGTREKRGAFTLTLDVDLRECHHDSFFAEEDIPQLLYEKTRHAVMDDRVYCDEHILHTLQSHGAAGLFIDPERALSSWNSLHTRTSPRKGTALYHTHIPDNAFETIATSLAEGVGVGSTARIQNINKKTVLRILAKAGDHAIKVNRSLLTNVHVTECQLDEMWSFVGKKEKNLDSIEKLQRILGDSWIWIAFDARHKIVLAYIIGKRTLPHAISLLEQVKQITPCMPELFSSDQLDHYANALLQVYGKRIQPPRKPGPGRPPHPRIVPPEDLLYVHVVKHYKRYRVVKVTRNVVFGDPERIEHILATSEVSRTINTSAH